MKKSDELKKDIAAKRVEVENFKNNQQMQEAANASDELLKMYDSYKTARALEISATENFANNIENFYTVTPKDSAKIRNRAFNKLILGKQLTDEEKTAYFNDGTDTTITKTGLLESTDEKGGYLVPNEQLGILREYRRAYVQLRDYCHVINVNAPTGKYPTLGEETGVLVNFSELEKINEKDFSFGQVEFSVKDYGDIVPISNQLIQDANVNILDIVGQRLARMAVNTENAEILKLLATLTSKAITDWKDLAKILNVDLDAIFYANAKIFTNQDGFQWLSELEDDNKRPLLNVDLVESDTYRFRGKPVVVLPNSTLKTENKKIPFFVGNLADFAVLFERQGVEMATSTEFMFGKYATAIRCVVRFGVGKDDTDAIKACYVSV